MITVDAVATAAMVRFGSDAELDVTVKESKNNVENETHAYVFFWEQDHAIKMNAGMHLLFNSECPV